jgi:hypothetical protein
LQTSILWGKQPAFQVLGLPSRYAAILALVSFESLDPNLAADILDSDSLECLYPNDEPAFFKVLYSGFILFK